MVIICFVIVLDVIFKGDCVVLSVIVVSIDWLFYFVINMRLNVLVIILSGVVIFFVFDFFKNFCVFVSLLELEVFCDGCFDGVF